MCRIPSDASSVDAAAGQWGGEDPLAGCTGDSLPGGKPRTSSGRKPVAIGNEALLLLLLLLLLAGWSQTMVRGVRHLNMDVLLSMTTGAGRRPCCQ